MSKKYDPTSGEDYLGLSRLTARGAPSRRTEKELNTMRIPTILFEKTPYYWADQPDDKDSLMETFQEQSSNDKKKKWEEMEKKGATTDEMVGKLIRMDEKQERNFASVKKLIKSRIKRLTPEDTPNRKGHMKATFLAALHGPTIGIDKQNLALQFLPDDAKKEEMKWLGEGAVKNYAWERFRGRKHPPGHSPSPHLRPPVQRSDTYRKVDEMKMRAREEKKKEELRVAERAATRPEREKKKEEKEFARQVSDMKKEHKSAKERWRKPVIPKGSGRKGTRLGAKKVEVKPLLTKTRTLMKVARKRKTNKELYTDIPRHPLFSDAKTDKYYNPRVVSDANFFKAKAPRKQSSPLSPGWIETKKRKRGASTAERKSLLEEAIERESKRRKKK